jgi:hypothetical protein
VIIINQLSFDSTKVLPPLSTFYPEELECVRKEKLVTKAIELFDLGKDWERALKISEELNKYFQKEYKYKELSSVIKKTGSLFEKINDQKRLFSSYFYVCFYGNGFGESGVQNKRYIYKGREAERLMDFHERLMKRFPNAEMIPGGKEPAKEYLEGDGQYIQIMTIYPSSQRDIETSCAPSPVQRIPQNIASYSPSNNINIFNYSQTFRMNPKEKIQHEFRDLYIR